MITRAALDGARATALTACVLLLGSLAIAVRPVSYRATFTLVAVGIAALVTPVPGRGDRASRGAWMLVTAVGMAAFAGGRALGSPLGIRYTLLGIATIAVAAVCEEAFFRRLVFGAVESRAGAGAALIVSAALFAVVHVPIYGWGAFPIDIAAGLVLGWQRAGTGGWSSPAATHVVANLLQMG